MTNIGSTKISNVTIQKISGSHQLQSIDLSISNKTMDINQTSTISANFLYLTVSYQVGIFKSGFCKRKVENQYKSIILQVQCFGLIWSRKNQQQIPICLLMFPGNQSMQQLFMTLVFMKISSTHLPKKIVINFIQLLIPQEASLLKCL
ncbi:MAG: hypothetical protein OMM_05386 [Candidatus Magnetoglobus multicellularis str. Araruama]|uniref:Uncharacterized protein n=1 Tax=Candidatus Magnetoglobus multicellularis str. Araruama TaxID=890399 RepID=A0A1V1NWK4_9BACT|nr:MAG: hypothetical protein OMM_05386 [Candidatus Magnetoglobus multicellularis str. Araruama]